MKPVVRAEWMRVSRGKCLGIFGPNGAGKTTLVRGMTGLLKPISGTVRRSGVRRIGYLPQHRAMELHWPMTGLDAASLAVSATRRLGWLHGGTARVRDSMERLEVGSLAQRPFAKLSGGQQQRLLLAGALAADPDVLVLDEPTDGLDIRSRASLMAVLSGLTGAGLSTVIISHGVEDLMALASEVAWLRPGAAGRRRKRRRCRSTSMPGPAAS